MEKIKKKSTKRIRNAGLILIPVMLLILLFIDFNKKENSSLLIGDSGFLVSYLIALIYFIVVAVRNKFFFRYKQIDKKVFIIPLILFSISSFTLNYYIRIFSEFTLWLKVYLFLFYIAFFAIIYIEKLPKILRGIIFFFLGAGVVLSTYFALYLVPLYHIATIGLFVFGLTVHLFIPLFITIAVIIIFIKLKKTKAEKFLFLYGLLIPFLVITLFLFRWNNLKKEVHQSTASLITRPDNTLPEWVLLCQDIDSDEFTQKIIKGNLVYGTFESMWNGFRGTAFDEIKKHDPLINIGIALLGDVDIDENTRVKILKSQFNARHLGQRKLWSGKDLGTVEVLNNVKIYTDYRLAYFEKIITVKNFNTWENDRQEAAFTFYLPEGSVATSLSLWINGKEEKSRLTTKSKADSAYVNIVGVEQRDPALLHWQEGNTLTVTVFPCTPKENRKFKIGITCPLQKNKNTLTLSNIYFEGPVVQNILETTKIAFESEKETGNISLPSGFKKELDGNYIYSGSFRPYWEASCNSTDLSRKKFFFNGYTYAVNEMKKEFEIFKPEKIYLDINKSWSEEEYNEIVRLFSGKDIYIHKDKWIKLTQENHSEVFKIGSDKNFSLFPFHKISDWKHSLVISKSTELSPNLSDLEGSRFLEELLQKSPDFKNKKVNLFQIGRVSSPYIKSLKELRLINFHSGNFSELSRMIHKKQFYKYNADSSKINLEMAEMTIRKDTNEVVSEAPDHLLRLFAYNSLLKNMGSDYLNKEKMNNFINDWTQIANEAYIVSPVSSLIVLETKKDYDRFQISENENSLKNAAMKSSGAVPEPKEWLMIGLLLILIFFLFFHKKKRNFLKWKQK